MSRPSGSRTALGLACLWPWHPEAQPWPEDRPGPAAERGSRMHARAAALLAADAPQVPALDAGEEDGVVAMVRAVASLAGIDARPLTEVAFAYDASSDQSTYLGRHLERDYSAAPRGTRCLSLDVVWQDGDAVVVVDFKTGRAEHVEAAAENAQLALGALATARHHGVQRAVVALVFEDGRIDAHELDALDLDAWADRLRQNDRALDEASASPSPGSHCGYCPAKGKCPVTRAAVAEVLPMLDVERGMLEAIVSPEDAARRVVRLKLIEDAWETAKAQADAMLREYVRAHGPIPMGNGKVRALVQQAGRETIQWTDEDKARAQAEGRVKRGAPVEVWRDKKAG